MKTQEVIEQAQDLVKQLRGRINGGQIGLQDAEGKILEFVNWVGDMMVQEVVEGVEEPTHANQIKVGTRWRCSSGCAIYASSTDLGRR